MAKKKKEEILPQFSPLSSCLIIDSSHKSRTQLLTRTKASDLFENVIEASSISQASRSIVYTEYDACILGPSLSDQLVNDFLADVKPKSKASDCAFIVIVKPDKQTLGLFSLAHQVFPMPSSTRMLFEGIVKAILLAGGASPWPGIKLSEDGCITILENGIWKVIGDEHCKVAGINAHTLAPDFLLSGERDSIEKFCEAIPKTPKDRIEKVILALLAGANADSDPFVPYFITAIKEWRTDITFMSLKEASLALKQRLLSFSESTENQESAETI